LLREKFLRIQRITGTGDVDQWSEPMLDLPEPSTTHTQKKGNKNINRRLRDYNRGGELVQNTLCTHEIFTVQLPCTANINFLKSFIY
jgi:hypothetical protein